MAMLNDAGQETSIDEPGDRFELLNILGQGAYGTVYRANDRITGEEVAIKVINLGDQPTEEFNQIKQEIRFLESCDHPNVVKYKGSYQRSNELWIVMEYCGGGSVSDVISASGEPMEEEVIAHICNESLKGLSYLHSKDKVHRDIKCGNILLTDCGEVKLADFGVAAQLTSTLSKRQTFIGTPHWMAPEVIQESRYDGKVDVWALGICAIEMAELTPPRWSVHPLRVIFMISRDPPPKLTKQPDQWSPLLHDFLAQCLQKDPKVRPTARYLLQHRFALQATQDARVQLQPLINMAQKYLAEVSTPAPEMEGNVKELAGADTGKFSWRGAAGAQGAAGATVAAGGKKRPQLAQIQADMQDHLPEPSVSPLPRGARGGGFASGTMLVHDSNTMVVHDSGTMVVHDSSASDTKVVHDASTVVVRHDALSNQTAAHPWTIEAAAAAAAADAASVFSQSEAGSAPGSRHPSPTKAPRSGGGGGAAAAVVEHGANSPSTSTTYQFDASTRIGKDSTGGSGADEAGGYMAAVKAAAREGRKAAGASGAGPAAVAVSSSAPPVKVKSDEERALGRIFAAYEGGLVVPVPFLSAAASQPLALLDPPSQPPKCTPMPVGLEDGIDPRVHEVLLQMVRQSASMSSKGSQCDIKGIPQELVKRVLEYPELQNLARSLSYQQRCQQVLPLDKHASEQLLQSVDDLSVTLRTLLAL